MEKYEEAILSLAMTGSLRQLQEAVAELQSSTNTYAISDGLRVIANKAVPLLEAERKEKYASCSRSGKAKRVIRAHDEVLGNLWFVVCHKDVPPKGYRDFFTRRIEEFKSTSDYPRRMMRKVSEAPFWFKNLPVLSVLSFFSFVVYTYLWHITSTITSQEAGREEEAIYAALDERSGEAFEQDMERFQEIFTRMYTKLHNLTASSWHNSLPSSSNDNMSDKVRTCLQNSLAFLNECDKIFPYASYRNKPFLKTIVKGWKETVGGTVEDPKLGPTKKGEDIYNYYCSTWAELLNKLVTKEDDNRLITLQSGYLVTREIANGYRKSAKAALSYIGFTEGKRRRVRDMRLQSDVAQIWDTLFNVSRELVTRICKEERFRFQDNQTNAQMVETQLTGLGAIIEKRLQPIISSFWAFRTLADHYETFYPNAVAHYM